jgi:hypothetical protein
MELADISSEARDVDKAKLLNTRVKKKSGTRVFPGA